MAYIYVLECRDGSYYTGITTDLTKRLRQHWGHLAGGAKYTRSHPPKRLLCVWETADYSQAKRFEAAFKQLTRQQKEQLIAAPEGWQKFLPRLSELEFLPMPAEKLSAYTKIGSFNKLFEQ